MSGMANMSTMLKTAMRRGASWNQRRLINEAHRKLHSRSVFMNNGNSISNVSSSRTGKAINVAASTRRSQKSHRALAAAGLSTASSSAAPVAATAANEHNNNNSHGQRLRNSQLAAALGLLGGAAATAWHNTSTDCEAANEAKKRKSHPRPLANSVTNDKAMVASTSNAAVSSNKQSVANWTPATVAGENFEDVVDAHEIDGYPVYTSDQVAENDGSDGKPIWMTYGGVVYDVTDFIANHPGGSEKIMMAAGSSIEPYWHTYRQHFASDLPTRLLEHMVIGRLADDDQDKVDEQMDIIYETSEDPFSKEPVRHKALRVHSEQSMNAETPADLLTKQHLTPTSIFYIRHHHPVPFLTTEQVEAYEVSIDLSAYGKGTVKLSLEDLKKMPKTEVVATLQCGGNRRSGFNKYQRTSGTGWGQGAISTAKWGGVLLKDILKHAGLEDPIDAQENSNLHHVRFHSLDGVMASIGIEKATNPYGDCLIAYEMNGESLPRDHGYPLRAIVPGYTGIRNVKWLSKIELSKEEAEGAWQRGLNYKILPPSVTDASQVNIEEMPGMMEASLFSGITRMEAPGSFAKNAQPGDRVTMKVGGWAWAGGGRNIVRVDVTGDENKTWTTAVLGDGSEQRTGRAWAWTFWEAEVPAVVKEDRSVEVACKAIDAAFNVQPESCDHVWNVRGLGNNSWFRVTYRLPEQQRQL